MRVLFTILFSILVSCNLQGKKGVNISCTEKLVLKDSLVINWKLDSLGCNGFRNATVLQVIFEKYWLYTKGVNEIKIVLGRANEEYVNWLNDKEVNQYLDIILEIVALMVSFHFKVKSVGLKF